MKKLSLLAISALFIFSCQTENQDNQTPVQQSVLPSVAPSVASTTPSAKPTVAPTPTATTTPPALLTGEKDEDSDTLNKIDKDATSTDTKTLQTGINWKTYNPIVKGKKYTYSFTVKEGTNEIKSDVLWEISEVSATGYILKKSILANTSALSTVSVPVAMNGDGSPSIVPVTEVGGDKVEPTRKVEAFDKTEKVKVPYKELDAVKLVSTATSSKGTIKTTNWYSANIGMIKSVQESATGTATLELKDFK
ncbi:MAG: hypothetical protein U0457_10025 [Candidatus Sericytochromatia bacterium]